MGIFVKCTCPSCFEEIYLGECAIVSGTRSKRVNGKDVPEELKHKSQGTFARMNVEPLDGPKYTKDLARRVCTECEYELPPNIESVPSITLAVVGDTFSGKSHFIAGFIQQLKADMLGNTTGFARLTCSTQDVEQQYIADYFSPLYINKRIINQNQPLPVTTKTLRPLIYTLTVASSPKHPPISVNLMIYDIAGEAFESHTRLVNVGQFALNTNALIFVVDLHTITPIFAELPLALQFLLEDNFKVAQRRRAVDSINTIMPVFERYHKQADGASLAGIPVAVMLSKADLLKAIYFEKLRKNSNAKPYTFFENPPYGGDLNLKDVDIVDHDVREILKEYKQGDLLAATRRFKDVKFFATSATGKPPDEQGNFSTIEHYRCLDPVLWILYKLGVIRGS